MLILKALRHGAKHEFDIAVHIHTVSDSLLPIEEGSLYPALRRMDLIDGEWRTTPNGRRARYYGLTDARERRLAEAEASWNVFSQGIRAVNA